MRHEINPDDHGPLGRTMADAISTCVHCGFCLPACPTYQELGRETDSPRGRIILMKEVLEGTLPIEKAAPHLDACLGCLGCEPACPSGVPYGDLISPFRATKSSEQPKSLANRFKRWTAQLTLPHPNRFRLAAFSGRLAKPMARWLPGPMRVMLDLLPDKIPSKQSWVGTHQADGDCKGRVALLTGCAQSVLDPDINTATIEVLNRNGFDVVVPAAQTCCGALSWHVGNLKQAQRFARKNLRAFEGSFDAIVTNAAGCGSGMHEYKLILKGTADEEAAAEFCEKVCDVSQWLAQLPKLAEFPSRKKSQQTQLGNPGSESSDEIRIAYHDACHLANAQGIRRQPRDLLRQIPGVSVCEIPEGHLCCGSAGTYNLDQPEIAGSLGRQKVENIATTEAHLVATGNIGCMTQISNHVNKQGLQIPVLHTMQVLRDAYEGKL